MRQLATLLITIIVSIEAGAEIFIVNNTNSVSRLTPLEIRDIYLGATLFWENEEKILIASYNASSPLSQRMAQKYLGMSPNQVYMNWIRVSLSGKAAPPKILRSEDEVKELVAQNPGSIGYVSSQDNLPATVKVIEVK